jgi:hypothetical protein
LKGRIAAIQENRAGDRESKQIMKRIDKILNERIENADVYDDTIVRQMIECIKVFRDGHITVYFGGGTAVEEHI